MPGVSTMMRTIVILLPVILVAVIVGFFSKENDAQQSQPPIIMQPHHDITAEPFAVIELFTSEGCSSCPPADRLLSTIATGARARNQRIYPLSFHVDYWNYLGWRDPFSDAVYSARQRHYGNVLDLRSIYTPQMIINGTTEFVGSEESTATAGIDAALQQQAHCSIALAITGNTSAEIGLRYEIQGASPSSMLNVAVVERNLVTNVPKGENAGRELHHDNVVRVFRTISLEHGMAGETTIDLPRSISRAHTSIIAYVQLPETMSIVGATGIDLQ
jgi:hypothetical protein